MGSRARQPGGPNVGRRALAIGLAALGFAGASCSTEPLAPDRQAADGFTAERGVGLGPDPTPIESLRVAVETGEVNGAGTQNPVLVWFDNRSHRLSRQPTADFAPGERVVATLYSEDLPATLGELRRASILLTLHLTRAAIASSWYCQAASVEVLLEG